MSVSFERNVALFGGGRGIRLANDEVELVASTDYGPRILEYRRRGGDNVFGFIRPSEQAKPTPFGEPWHIYGGHRLWHAPEHPVRSYIPDNAPFEAAFDGATVALLPPIEAVTLLEKEVRVSLEPSGSRVRVEHRVTNRSNETAQLALWALSVMALRGQAIFPSPRFVPFPEGLLPVSRLVLWPYTRLADPRFRFGSHFVRVRQDPAAASPQKLGLLDVEHGWMAYALGELLFVKRFTPATPATPLVDLGCNVETFTDAKSLELETLSPEIAIAPGETGVHIERWELFTNITLPDDDAAAARVLADLDLR